MGAMVQPAHTHHACRFCRSKRSKCDGKYPCDRCKRWNQPCAYDDRTSESKDELRRQREELLAQNRDADAVLKALQDEDLAEATFASLRNRTPIDQIATSLKQSKPEEYQASPSADRLLSVPSTSAGLSPSHVRAGSSASHDANSNPTSPASVSLRRTEKSPMLQEGDSRILGPTELIPGSSYVPERILGLSPGRVQKFLEVFFDRQYVPLLFINRELFIQDYTNGGARFCSPALVRAILCSACRLLGGYDDRSSFLVNIAGRLLHESKEMLRRGATRPASLPDAQALALLAIHQLGSHEKSEALDLIEDSVGMLARLSVERDPDHHISALSWSSQVTTFLHGAVSITRIIRLFSECLISVSDPNKNAKGQQWQCDIARRPDDSLLELLQIPSEIEPSNSAFNLLVTTTSSIYCWLSTVTRPQLNEYPEGLLGVYRACLSQYSELIVALQLLKVSGVSLTLTHLIYHFSLLSLCHPFSHISSNGAPIDFRAICLEAAQAILSLSASCVDLGLVVPYFVPMFVHAAAIVSIDLAVNMAISPTPAPSVPHESSSSSTEQIGSSSAMSLRTPATVITSPMSSDTPSISSSVIEGGAQEKRKFAKISVSPLPSPGPTLATPGVKEALDCLDAMGGDFPAARDAKSHIQGLLQVDAAPLSASADGYGFPG